jgi:hypothetical protein
MPDYVKYICPPVPQDALKASDNLSVRREFGAAYEKDGMLIIPVAMVAPEAGYRPPATVTPPPVASLPEGSLVGTISTAPRPSQWRGCDARWRWTTSLRPATAADDTFRRSRPGWAHGLVAQSFAGERFILRAVHSENLDPGTGLVQVEAKLPRFGRDNIGLEAAVSRLSLEPAVSSVSWTVENPSAALAAG